mgnify:CR=1 FL=1
MNRNTLGSLFDFLRSVEVHKEKNKMTFGNLAIVMGPNILKSPSVMDLSGMTLIPNLIAFMMERKEEIFD